jgi:hypothetical protein
VDRPAMERNARRQAAWLGYVRNLSSTTSMTKARLRRSTPAS